VISTPKEVDEIWQLGDSPHSREDCVSLKSPDPVDAVPEAFLAGVLRDVCSRKTDYSVRLPDRDAHPRQLRPVMSRYADARYPAAPWPSRYGRCCGSTDIAGVARAATLK
jgi:hypothetical protein